MLYSITIKKLEFYESKLGLNRVINKVHLFVSPMLKCATDNVLSVFYSGKIQYYSDL